MNLRALENIHLSHGKVLEKSWKIVSEKGYEPCAKFKSAAILSLLVSMEMVQSIPTRARAA